MPILILSKKPLTVSSYRDIALEENTIKRYVVYKDNKSLTVYLTI